jgi:hypothetical protein
MVSQPNVQHQVLGIVLATVLPPQSRAGHGRRTLSSEQAKDISKTIAYGSGKTVFKFIAFSVLVLGVGLVVGFGKENWLLGGPLAALAAAVIVWQIHGLLSSEPFLRLSPAGLRLNLDGYVFADIPWQEVERITSLDLTYAMVQRRWSGYSIAKDQYRDVTALQISEAFTDETIRPLWRAVDRHRGLRRLARIGLTTFTLAPNATASRLSNIFPTQDGKRFVALPHSVLSANRYQLRSEVEARWRAFGKKTATGVTPPDEQEA